MTRERQAPRIVPAAGARSWRVSWYSSEDADADEGTMRGSPDVIALVVNQLMHDHQKGPTDIVLRREA